MLWGVTSYFNPSGFKSRPANYRTFRRHLRAPLVTVELSFNGRFELGPGDAEILVQLAGRDVLWQKERLLNVALRHLPDDCDTVAWLDCDVVLGSEDWPERARAALERFSLVQLFSERCDPAPWAARAVPGWRPVYWSAPARGYKIANGRYEEEAENRNAGVFMESGYSAAGLAWAAPRALLDRHGLYDARILGGGDRAILSAAIGEFGHYVGSHAMNHRQIEHYRLWGDPFFADVRGRVGYLDGRIYHLWHGDLKDRNYRERQRHLAEMDFDPFADIALDSNGCWRWNTDKRELHEYVSNYFDTRNEDGPATPGAFATVAFAP